MPLRNLPTSKNGIVISTPTSQPCADQTADQIPNIREWKWTSLMSCVFFPKQKRESTHSTHVDGRHWSVPWSLSRNAVSGPPHVSRSREAVNAAVWARLGLNRSGLRHASLELRARQGTQVVRCNRHWPAGLVETAMKETGSWVPVVGGPK